MANPALIRPTLALCTTFAAFSLVQDQAASFEWHTDLVKARALAATAGRPLLIVFR